MSERRLLLKPEEAMEVLQIGRSHLYQLLLRGELRSVKIGRSRRIPAVALEDFVCRLLDEQCADQEQKAWPG